MEPKIDLKLKPFEELKLREAIENGQTVPSVEGCKVCSAQMLSITIVTGHGLVEHLSCPKCGERDIRPVSL